MKIKDKHDYSLKQKPITLKPENTVQEALDVMCEKNIGSVIIADKDDKLLGIVTERDMMKRVLAKGIDLKKTKIDKIMTKNIHAAKEEDDLIDWMRIMSNERFRHLPIVDDKNRIINLMSQGDFVAFTYPDLFEKLKQNLKNRLGLLFQVIMVILAVTTLTLLAFEL